MKRMIMMAAVALGCAAGALADTSFAYQGNLREANGSPVSNKTITAVIRLYEKEEGGSALWGRKFGAMTSTDGTFNIEVSDSLGDDLLDGSAPKDSTLKKVMAKYTSFYLGLDVTIPPDLGSGEVAPRQKVIPVPQALFAQDVKEASGDFSVRGSATFHGGILFTNVKDAKQMCSLADGKITANKMIVSDASTDDLTVRQDLTVDQDASVKRNLTVGAGLTVSGAKVDAPSAAMTVKSLKVSSADFTVNGMSVAIPVGVITLWYGAENNVPEGWAICNGQVSNGIQTPNLTGRFVVGAGQEIKNGSLTGKAGDGGDVYMPGTTGGERSHTLSVGEMPSHNHSTTMYTADVVASWKNARTFLMPTDHYGSESKCDITSSQSGSNQAHENRPPYYALLYIMKVK